MNRVRFGPFEADLETGELFQADRRIALQRQPFEMLAVLLAQPGRLVTREALRARLWPGALCGEFDDGINTAARKLRRALGDSARRPRYLETLSRRGYRLLGRVEPVSDLER